MFIVTHNRSIILLIFENFNHDYDDTVGPYILPHLNNVIVHVPVSIVATVIISALLILRVNK